MSGDLLQTKLYRPRSRPGYVPRQRLQARLTAGLAARVTLVAAPAGYGKTTLLATWLEEVENRKSEISRPDSSFPTLDFAPPTPAWLTLDRADNDLPRFVRYLFAAVGRALPSVEPGLSNMLGGTSIADGPLLIQALINAVAEQPQKVLLVLDDYHVIDEPAIHDATTLLIDYLPPNCHVVLAARHDPPLPLPRWRARGQLHELRADELRFSPEEARDFLSRTMHLPVAEEVAELLEARTEGWIAGLQLAALSLRGRSNTADLAEQFGGTDRHVADYLLTEVLNGQPAGLQDFLLRTSILDRLQADLCNALLERNDSHAALERLDVDNLFLIPLDGRRRWYRYHHLFRDLLRERLARRIDATETARLQRRAARWYAAHGHLQEAVDHFLAAGEPSAAAELLAGLPLHAFWQTNAEGTVRRWLDRIPDDALAAYPRAAIIAAAAHLLVGAIPRTRHFLALVDGDASVRAEYALLQSILVRNEGDNVAALALAEEAAGALAPDDMMLRASAGIQVANNLQALGRPEAARRSLVTLRRELARQAATAPENDLGAGAHVDLQFLWLLAQHEQSRGRLNVARAYCDEGLALLARRGESETPAAGLLLGILAELHYEWNELSAADRCVAQALTIAHRAAISDIVITATFCQADLACARGAWDDMRAALETLLALVRRSAMPDLLAQFEALVVRLDLRSGELARALRWADGSGLALTGQPTYQTLNAFISLALIRLAEARTLGEPRLLPDVAALLRRLLALAETYRYRALQAQLQLQLAQATAMTEGQEAALLILEDALAIGQASGLVRTFVDTGPGIVELLRAAVVAGLRPGYSRRLLAAFGTDVGAPAGIDPLTEREREILGLLAAGLTNRQICDELVLSENTVRTHLKNLYSKLNVHRRDAAITRARSLGILP